MRISPIRILLKALYGVMLALLTAMAQATIVSFEANGFADPDWPVYCGPNCLPLNVKLQYDLSRGTRALNEPDSDTIISIYGGDQSGQPTLAGSPLLNGEISIGGSTWQLNGSEFFYLLAQSNPVLYISVEGSTSANSVEYLQLTISLPFPNWRLDPGQINSSAYGEGFFSKILIDPFFGNSYQQRQFLNVTSISFQNDASVSIPSSLMLLCIGILSVGWRLTKQKLRADGNHSALFSRAAWTYRLALDGVSADLFSGNTNNSFRSYKAARKQSNRPNQTL
jgi:hypothetical protein